MDFGKRANQQLAFERLAKFLTLRIYLPKDSRSYAFTAPGYDDTGKLSFVRINLRPSLVRRLMETNVPASEKLMLEGWLALNVFAPEDLTSARNSTHVMIDRTRNMCKKCADSIGGVLTGS